MADKKQLEEAIQKKKGKLAPSVSQGIVGGDYKKAPFVPIKPEEARQLAADGWISQSYMQHLLSTASSHSDGVGVIWPHEAILACDRKHLHPLFRDAILAATYPNCSPAVWRIREESGGKHPELDK